MKKVISTMFALVVFASQAFAYENYILISDKNISDVDVKDATIISVVPITTLNNEKTSAIITSLKSGDTQFTFNKGKKLVSFEVKVTPDKTVISNVAGVKIILIDLPVELRK